VYSLSLSLSLSRDDKCNRLLGKPVDICKNNIKIKIENVFNII
jgi:hypothetical protein